MTDYATAGRSTSESNRTITGFFDDREAAEHAVQALVDAGLDRGDISTVAGHDGGVPGEHRGFWEQLKDFFLPDEDRYAYAEGLRRGGHVVTVHTTDALADRVFAVMEQYGAIDMDAREVRWREEGWHGWVPGSMDDSIPVPRGQRVPPQVDPAESEAQIRAPVGATPRIGRREIEHGRLSARSYIYDDL